MNLHTSLVSLALALSLAAASDSSEKPGARAGLGGLSGHVPPPNAAASITTSAGSCIRFISVLVPVNEGNYVVGVSFAYRDMNRDGSYTPGVDKLEVCVNCSDACDWGP
jgi:hypothetical protein